MRQEPARGQESVWDYPRPPEVRPDSRLITIEYGGALIAKTRRALKVLETSHPPVFYVPRPDIEVIYLHPSTLTTWCEFKGQASYWSVTVEGRTSQQAAWEYRQPTAGYEELLDHLAFYPSRMDRCTVDGTEVVAQEGDFYGGWITPEIVGPFKGGPGTRGW